MARGLRPLGIKRVVLIVWAPLLGLGAMAGGACGGSSSPAVTAPVRAAGAPATPP